MSSLTVNVDIAAILRSAYRKNEPDPAQIAMLSELNGAEGITVQFRRDRKYIRERDLYLLKGIVKSKLFIEMPPNEEAISKIMEIKPSMVILSADHADSDTPLAPIDFASAPVDYSTFSNQLNSVDINVGFFVEPDIDEIKGAARANAQAVLINCAGYSQARNIEDAQQELDRIDKATQVAVKNNLSIYAGRGIHYKNIRPLSELNLFDEFFIGHAVCARAIMVGLERAVTEMITILKEK